MENTNFEFLLILATQKLSRGEYRVFLAILLEDKSGFDFILLKSLVYGNENLNVNLIMENTNFEFLLILAAQKSSRGEYRVFLAILLKINLALTSTY